MNSNTLLDLAEIYQNISEGSQNFIAEGFDDETPEQRRRRTANPQTAAQRRAQEAERKAKEGIGDPNTSKRGGSGIRGELSALEKAKKDREAAAAAEEARQRAASAEVIARRKEAERRKAQGLPPAPKPKPKPTVITRLAPETEPDAPTEHDIATGRRLGRRGTTTPEKKPEDESTLAARRRKAALKMLAKLQGKEDDSQNESYVVESRRKKKSKKPARWWDDDGDGIGWEPGEVSGSFKRKPRVAKEEYSNWREDLVELSGILENQKKK